ncbi:MAG: hypothetical protein MJ106_01985, partial [Lentisphaeria bacterium]|nr:hypothetical protein [Lentisphaeria bacterium]
MIRLSAIQSILFALCCFLLTAASRASFQDDCRAIGAFPHRLSGSDNNHEAARYSERRLSELSPDELIVQPFSTTQTKTECCELQTPAGESIPLLPMRPDGIIPPVTPPEGVTGKLVRLGTGTSDELNASDSLEGCIAVLDYNCGQGWLRALRLGASAVIFTSESTPQGTHFHYTETNANLLRFYYDGPETELPPDGTTVTLKSKVIWQAATAQNVIAFFRGTAPMFSQGKEEIMVLAANLDTFGEVPELSPGGRSAANCAALLAIAEAISQNRPRRHTLIVFLDNQARAHEGCGLFYRVTDNLKERLESFQNECVFHEEMLKLLANPFPLTAKVPSVRRHFLNQLAEKAQDAAQKYKNEEYSLSDELREYARAYGGNPPEDIARRILEINVTPSGNPAASQSGLLEQAVAKKHQWNDLQRLIGQQKRDPSGTDKPLDLSPELRQNLEKLLELLRIDLEQRESELTLEKQHLDAARRLSAILQNNLVILHASLLLGDTLDKWGLAIGGDSNVHTTYDNPGLYGKIQSAFLKMHRARLDADLPSHFLAESADQTLSKPRILWGGSSLIHSGEMAGLFAIFNVAFATVQESAPREGTPGDTIDSLKLSVIEAQTEDIISALCATANAPDAVRASVAGNSEHLSLKHSIVPQKHYFDPSFGKDFIGRGPMVMGMLPGTSLPNLPIPGATVQLRFADQTTLAFNEKKMPAFDNFQILRTNQHGIYTLVPHQTNINKYRGFAVVFNKDGIVDEASDMENAPKFKFRLNTYKAHHGCIILPPQQRIQKRLKEEVGIISAHTNSLLSTEKSFSETADGVVSWFSERREKGIKLFGLRQFVGLNNGTEFLEPTTVPAVDSIGTGFPMTQAPLNVNSAARSSGDLWRLDDARLRMLSSRGILDSALSEMHGRSEDMLREAAEPSIPPSRREALQTISFWSSLPAYQKIRSMLDDLVFALLILLLLSVPFSFSLERVLIGSTNIYRQIAWFAGFFLATFLILYFTHPAFSIANTPVIIFLGFAIIVMSGMVIFLILRKFETELKTLQGLAVTVHANNVSGVSTFLAAMQMGISTMRRRPSRTALTAVTIILLTFTILCFASFSTQSGIITIFTSPSPAYHGVDIHHRSWVPLNEDIFNVIKEKWPQARLFRRMWISPESLESPEMLLTTPTGEFPNAVRGVLGIEPDELVCREDMKMLFEGLSDGQFMITRPLAEALHASKGDTLLLKGKAFSIGRILDPVQLSAVKDMDMASILPVDFTADASASADDNDDQEADEAASQRTWTNLSVDQLAVMTARDAKSLGAFLYNLQLYTDTPSEALSLGENLSRFLSVPVLATRENGVYKHTLGTVLQPSGIKSLFFPVILGGLVIFGTMLGSVADRKKEIYTFSALGLAPKHVATLFFAESMVYALLGGMGGYLLAQGILKLLGFAAEYGLMRVPEMNMSSTNTIIAILIVMATVLVSAIYPALTASKSANPGLMRYWRPPTPKGDLLELTFPFTVSQYDITGVVAFLHEHFSNHTDAGLGSFMTEAPRITRPAGGVGLEAIVSLAPFDLGVSQFFTLESAPSEIAGINEIHVILRRRAGQPKDWQRLNKSFLDE